MRSFKVIPIARADVPDAGDMYCHECGAVCSREDQTEEP